MEKIGRYEILKELGRGGMGAVYEAWDPLLTRQVAVKVVLPDPNRKDGGISQSSKDRFAREAKAYARLKHANIVAVYDYGLNEQSLPFIVLEYVDGCSIGKLIDDKIPDAETVQKRLGLFYQILEAMRYAHEQDVVHRDLKPGNIMVDSGGQIKIMDFGLALLDDKHSQTQTNQSAGYTLSYAAPEQLNPKLYGQTSKRTDIYSLGVILYELLTGQLPFTSDNSAGVMYKILSVPAPSVRALNPGVSEALSNVVARCLEKEPVKRFESVQDLLASFGACPELQGIAKPSKSTLSNGNKGSSGGSTNPTAGGGFQGSSGPTASELGAQKGGQGAGTKTGPTISAGNTRPTVLSKGGSGATTNKDSVVTNVGFSGDTVQTRVTNRGTYERTVPSPQPVEPIKTYRPEEQPTVPYPVIQKSNDKANSYVILFLAVCCAFLAGLLLRGGLGGGAVPPEPKPIVAESYAMPTSKLEDEANPVSPGPTDKEPATKAVEEPLTPTPTTAVEEPTTSTPTAAVEEPTASAPIQGPAAVYANAQVGDRFDFGRYPQGPNGEVEPITWRVLERESDSLLILSEKGLDFKPYNETNVDITWADCTLRRWLNEDFIKAFNEQERNLIKTSYNESKLGLRFAGEKPPSSIVEDHVFLLSSGEACRYDFERACQPTDYAVRCGASREIFGCSWWLRSCGSLANSAEIVVCPYVLPGNQVSVYNCVRPALRLSIE